MTDTALNLVKPWLNLYRCSSYLLQEPQSLESDRPISKLLPLHHVAETLSLSVLTCTKRTLILGRVAVHIKWHEIYEASEICLAHN